MKSRIFITKIFKSSNNLYFSFIISLYFYFIILYPNKLYWVDDYYHIRDINTLGFNYIFQKFNSHFQVFQKVFFYFDISFLNYNPEVYSYLALVFLIITFLVFIRLTQIKIYKNYFLVFILIFFNPKIFPSISQPSNIVWFFGILLIVLFFFYKKRNITFSSFLLILSYFNFSLGLVLCLFCICNYLFDFYIGAKKKHNFIYFIISIVLILFYIFYNEGNNNFNFDKFSIQKILIIFFNFFSLIGSFYLPWLKSGVYLGFIIGLLQIIFIINLYNSKLKELLRNEFIIFGLLFSIATSIFRPEIFLGISPRYIFGILFFQIGFYLEIFKNLKYINIKRIIVVLKIFFILNLLFPYTGLHWQLDRSYKSEKVIQCFKNVKSNELKTQNCYYNAQKTVFFGKMSFDQDEFKKILNKTLK